MMEISSRGYNMLTDQEKELFDQWYIDLKSKSNTRNQFSLSESKREKWIENNICPIKDKLEYLYDEGYGYKSIGKMLDISYTRVRNIINKYTDVQPRKGYNVVTNKLREIRSDNVKGSKSPWYDWPNKKPEMQKKSKTGISGYYKRKWDGKYCWLRSSYEYIYAKWLDEQNIKWRAESKVYKLSNGERYRPDFFIYDEEDGLLSIVEIKSRYFNKGNREYKYHMFKDEYSIECSLVTDPNIFIKENNTYKKELEEWKKQRVLPEQLEES